MKSSISVHQLGKTFQLRSSEQPTSLTERVTHAIHTPFFFHRSTSQPTYCALTNISFEVQPGEVVGIVGRNGAGKSTLLKILSGITPPSAGKVTLRGKVGSLLEVGTGFHPELSGRENIFLNGAILGMKPSEVRQQLQEIVEFAEVQTFLDQPLKRYSTGMQARLAFSVAAHLQTEILLVDEVLAVGDAAFQQRCLQKMQEVSQHGRTLLFVSHNAQAVQQLCHRCILLEQGKQIADGDTKTIFQKYLRSAGLSTPQRSYPPNGRGDTQAKLVQAEVVNSQGTQQAIFDVREPISVKIEIAVLENKLPLTPYIHLFTSNGEELFVSSDQTSSVANDTSHKKGRYTKIVEIPGNLLATGFYEVAVGVNTLTPPVTHVFERNVLSFEVTEDRTLPGKTARGSYPGELRGLFRPLLTWKSMEHKRL